MRNIKIVYIILLHLVSLSWANQLQAQAPASAKPTAPLSTQVDWCSTNLNSQQIYTLHQIYKTIDEYDCESAYKKAKRLEVLDLSHKALEDVSLLSSLTQLKKLWLTGNKLKDISALRPLRRLEVLSIAQQEQPLDISPLSDMRVMIELYLYRNKITDISALKNMRILIVLRLNNNEIGDIRSLGDLKNLSRLDLFQNPISLASFRTQENCPQNTPSRLVNAFCSSPF